MPIIICPNCNERVVVGFDTCDFVHDCSQTSQSDIVTQEDVVIVGDWEDFDGIGTRAPQEVIRAGMVNELQGTRAGIEGEDKEADTRRGNRASTHRTRKHLEFINIKNKGLS